MNLRTIVAAIAGGITMAVLGFLIFGLALMSFSHDHMVQYAGLEKTPPDWIPVVLFNLATAWLIAFVFDKWAGIKNFGAGFAGGIFIMLPMAVTVYFQRLAFMNIYKDLMPVAVGIVGATLLGAIAGGVIGQILGMMNKPATSE